MNRRLFSLPTIAAAIIIASASAAQAQSKTRPSDEAGISLLGTRILVARGMIQDPDAPRVETAMRAAYENMRTDEDDERSPVVFQPEAIRGAPSDLLVYRARGPKTKLAVLFLHGYGGRFALPCWQIARVAAARGAMTACPDVGTDGAWWSPNGERIVRETYAALRAAGYERVVLAGLSSGGIGASRLAPKMPGAFVGLVLISGADPSAGAPSTPVLVVHGRRDAMVSVESSRAYAAKTQGELVTLADGHFAMMLDQSVADPAIGRFLDRF